MRSRRKLSVLRGEATPTRVTAVKAKVTVYRLRSRLPLLKRTTFRNALPRILVSYLPSLTSFSGVVAVGQAKLRLEEPGTPYFIEVYSDGEDVIVRFTKPTTPSLETALSEIRMFIRELRPLRDLAVATARVREPRGLRLCVETCVRDLDNVFRRCCFQERSKTWCKDYEQEEILDVYLFQDLVYLSQLLKTYDVLLIARAGDVVMPILRIEDAWRIAKLFSSSCRRKT